jgi:predicted ArsR family transcriptional regulator
VTTLRASQIETLEALGVREMSVDEVARALGVSHGAANGRLEGLEARGLVARTWHDRPWLGGAPYLYSLTPQGRAELSGGGGS